MKAEHDTYCKTSLYIVRTCKIQLIFIMIQAIATFVYLLIPKVNSHETFQDMILYGYRLIYKFSQICLIQVYLLIGIEYYIMRYIILFEKTKSVFEITYLYTNTINFRRMEERLNIFIKMFYSFMNLILLTGYILEIYL